MTIRLLILFFFFLPFQFALQPAGMVDLPVGRALAVIIFCVWLIEGLARQKLFIATSPVVACALSLLFLSGLSSVWAEDPAWTLRKFIFLLSYFPLLFVFSDVFREEGVRRRVVKSAVLGMTIAACVGIVQSFSSFFFGVERVFAFWIGHILPFFLGTAFSTEVAMYPSLLVNIGGETWMRATAFFPDPHMAAFAFGMMTPFAVILGASSLYSRYGRECWFLAAGTLLLADVLTFSRGGMVGLFGGAMAILWLFRRTVYSIVKANRKYALIMGAIMVAILFFFAPVRERIASTLYPEEGSNAARIIIWQQALGEISSRPFLGTGLGNYPLAIKPLADYREPIYAHNLFLDVTAELGMIGLVLFLGILFGGVRSLIKNDTSGTASPWKQAGFVSLIIFLVHSLFETALFSVHILPLLMLILSL